MRVCEFVTLLSFFHSSNVDKVNAYFIFSLSFLPSWKFNTFMSVCLPIYISLPKLQRFVEIILISHKMLCKTNLFFAYFCQFYPGSKSHSNLWLIIFPTISVLYAVIHQTLSILDNASCIHYFLCISTLVKAHFFIH